MVLADGGSALVAQVLVAAAACLIYSFFSDPFVCSLLFENKMKQTTTTKNQCSLKITKAEKSEKYKEEKKSLITVAFQGDPR